MGNLMYFGVVDEGSALGAATRYVGGTGAGNWSKIQDAIDNASVGDTVRVYAGTYYEDILINKSLNLIGNGSTNTTIIGNGTRDVIKITTNLVNITGFNITNGTSGIKIEGGAGLGDYISGDGVERTVLASTSLNYAYNDATRYNNGRKIATDGGTLFAVYDRRTSSSSYRQIFCARSSDNGVSWQDTQVSTTSTYWNDNQYNPSIAVDSNGVIYIVWHGEISTSGSYEQISFAKSTNGGVTFSTPTTISPYILGDYNYRPAIVVDGSNTIHVVWYGYTPSTGNFFNIQYSNSTNGGTSWSTITLLTSSSSYHSYNPTIAVDNNDNLHVAWYGRSSTYTATDNIYYRKFVTTWGTTDAVTTDTISSYDNEYPCITIDNNNKPHITWMRKTPTTNNYYFIFYSDNTSSSWSTPMQISMYNFNNFYPSISISADSVKHMVWHGRTSASPSYYQIVYSSNSGSGWSTPIGITTGNVDHYYPGLLEPRPQIVPRKGYALVYTKPGGYQYDIKYLSSAELRIGSPTMNNHIHNNTFIGNRIGIHIENSNESIIVNNTFDSNTVFGIFLNGSVNNYLYNNTMVSCGVFINGIKKENWNTHTITDNNTVNGKPLYYWKDVTNGVIPTGAGEVILANCIRVTVENQDASFGSVGIEVGFSHNCTIANNTCNYNNNDGIFFYQSDLMMLLNNTCNFNNKNGICINGVNRTDIPKPDDDIIFIDDFSTNKGWSGYGGSAEWERGSAQSGGNDPATDHSPTADNYVIGNDIGGQYNNGISGTQWLTSPIIDCTGWTNVYFEFYRWLGIESSNYDHAYIAVYNGASWTTIWSHSGGSFTDNSWNLRSFNVSIYADNKPNFRVRFGMGRTDGSVTYCGWNIDDVNITGDKPYKPEIVPIGNYTCRDNTCDSNMMDGIFISNSNNISLINNNFHNNYVGINITSSSNCSIINTTIIGSTIYDIRFANASSATALNCTFNATKVNYTDSASNLTVIWFMHVKVTNETGVPISNVNFVVKDNQTNVICNGTTDTTGYHKWIHCLHYIENQLGIIENHTPHNISVNKPMYEERYAYPEPVMDISKTVNIILYLDVTPPEPPTNLNFTKIGGTYLNMSWNESNSHDLRGYNININDTGSSTSFHLLDTTSNNYFNATGLLEEVTYYFVITAFDDVPWNSTNLTGSNTTIDISPPNAPTNLAISKMAHYFMNITWTPSNSPDVQGYEIYLNDTGSTTSYHLLNITQNTYYNHSGLQEETICYFKVRAFDEIPHFSVFTPIVSGRTPDITPPEPPTLLIISKLGGTYIELSWTASVSTDVNGYQIYINDTGSSVNFHYSTSTSNNFINHTGLLEETTYHFKIRAYDEMPLYSPFSNEVFATTPDVTPADTPTSLIFTSIGGTYLNLSWAGSTCSDLEGYQVHVNDSGSKSSFHPIATTTNCYFNYTGLPEETKYYFRLTAYDEVPLHSDFTYITSATTLDITPPIPPKNLITRNPSKHEIILSWTPNPEPDIAGYDIYMNDTGPGSSGPFYLLDTVLGNPYEYRVRYLCEKTTYSFFIIAFDEVPNYSGHSNVAIGSTLDKTAPSAPTGLFATAVSGTQIDLIWNANSEQDLVGYQIYMNDTGNNAAGTFHINHTIIGSETSYILTNLLEETTYHFKLKAFDDVPNYSPFSEVVFATTLDETPPSTPTGLAVSDPDDRNLTISWKRNFEMDLVGYILHRGLAADGPFTEINSKPISTTQYYDTGLEENTVYYYKIQAIDDANLRSPLSEAASGKTLFTPYLPEINKPPGEIILQEDMDDYRSVNLFQWFIDKNNNPLTFMHTSVENVEVIMFEENGTVILNPRDDWSGQETITFFARNEFSMISDEVTITVLPVNDPPTNVIITSPEDLAKITKGGYINFVGECFDPDVNYGDELTFSWYSSINGTLGQGKTLRDIYLGVGEHLITLEVTDSYGETCEDTITVTVLDGAVSEDPEEDNTGLIIGSIGAIIIILIIILFLFLQFKKKKTPGPGSQAVPRSPAPKPVGPTPPAQAQYHTQTSTHPSGPIGSSTLFPASQARPQTLPIFKCPSCGSAIYEPNKCLNCGWMGK